MGLNAILGGLSSAAGIAGSLSSMFGGGGAMSTNDDIWEAMQRQESHNLSQARRMPGAQVAGLREAGLNPLLAIAGSPATGAGISAPSANSGQAVAKSNAAGALGTLGASLSQQAINRDVGQAQINNLDANSAKADAERKEIETRTGSGLYASIVAMNNATAAERSERLPLIKAQIAGEVQKVIESQSRVNSLNNEIRLIRERVRTEKSQQFRNYAESELSRLTGDLRIAEKDFNEARAEFTTIQSLIESEGWVADVLGTDSRLMTIIREGRDRLERNAQGLDQLPRSHYFKRLRGSPDGDSSAGLSR